MMNDETQFSHGCVLLLFVRALYLFIFRRLWRDSYSSCVFVRFGGFAPSLPYYRFMYQEEVPTEVV